MQILSYLFKKPQTGDKGSVFWPALEEDIQKMNDHTHNGTNSARLPNSSSYLSSVSVLSAASWSSVGGGKYRQLVTMPGTMLFQEYATLFRDVSTRVYYLLDVEQVSTNTFYVYINDNTKNILVLYVA